MKIAQQHVTLVHRYPVWAGDNADMTRILTVLERESEALLPVHIEAKTARSRRELERVDSMIDRLMTDIDGRGDFARPSEGARLERYQAAREDAVRRIDEEKSEAAGAALLSLAIQDRGGRRVFNGDAESCVTYLVGREYDSISVEAPAFDVPEHQVSLTADKERGMHLRVFSTDDRWATATMTYLQKEAGGGSPWWGFMRSTPFLLASYVIALAFILYNIGDFIAKVTTDTGTFPQAVGTYVWMLWSVLVLAGSLLGVRLTQAWIRAFEVVPDGSRPRGRMVVAWFAGAAAAIALSVVANVVTDALRG
ncbi:hypothetical protein [Microbacterium murale]|uniref:Uncharacterized protein n=1 Tax=Microbacterium murale TaxID=1081040 RepID=A0ABU0PED2_9MICO|nr:hypothetical protein [Microbacterium murale]MDQ0645670.1 hypothetical protein [Microbacterium murale]